MKNKKYELVREILNLYRVKALKGIDYLIDKGCIGGCIEKEDNLSITNKAWVYDNAIIHDNAKVYGDAHVYGSARVFDYVEICDNARVFGHAYVDKYASISGNAQVFEGAKVSDYAHVYDDAWVCGNADISGGASVFGNARITSDAKICNTARVHGNAYIGKYGYIQYMTDYLCVGPIGSRNGYTTFYKTKDKGIYVCCGCFNDSIKAFEKKVKKVHGEDQYNAEYFTAISLAKIKLS